MWLRPQVKILYKATLQYFTRYQSFRSYPPVPGPIDLIYRGRQKGFSVLLSTTQAMPDRKFSQPGKSLSGGLCTYQERVKISKCFDPYCIKLRMPCTLYSITSHENHQNFKHVGNFPYSYVRSVYSGYGLMGFP